MEKDKRSQFEHYSQLGALTERTISPSMPRDEKLYNLQADKQALKEAVRIAISRRDELYHKVIAYDKALSTESAKLAAKEKQVTELQIENKAALDRISLLERARRQDDSCELRKENTALKEQLAQVTDQLMEAQASGSHMYKPSMDTRKLLETVNEQSSDSLLEITRYIDYISHKIDDISDIKRIIDRRADGIENFRNLVEQRSYQEGLLITVQMISDIMEIQGNAARTTKNFQDTRKTPTFKVATEKGKLRSPSPLKLTVTEEMNDTPLSLSILDNSKLSKFWEEEQVSDSLAFTNERINQLSRRLKKTIKANYEKDIENEVSSIHSPQPVRSPATSPNPKILKSANSMNSMPRPSPEKKWTWNRSKSPQRRDVAQHCSKFQQWSSVKDFFAKDC